MAGWKEDKPIKSTNEEREVFAWDEQNVYLQWLFAVAIKGHHPKTLYFERNAGFFVEVECLGVFRSVSIISKG